MTSQYSANETIARMRRRLLEIDKLIFEIEQGRTPVTAKGAKRQVHWVRLCRKRLRESAG